MNLAINSESPQIMHIDLNSCFATVEQQARPLLRHKPLAVTNRKTKYCCIIAASYEAKGLGVKVGMRLDDAKRVVPKLIVVETDPPKYHYVYQKLMTIMKSYSPDLTMKSVDEGVIDFHSTREHINTKSLEDIALDIKQRLKDEVGCWMRCNVGIAPNRFLAKLAASLNKPNGLDIINHQNLRATLAKLELTDLPGIAEHNEARLNTYGIYTPIQFLDASSELLKRHVFRSVCGEDWYQRLRGYEIDKQASGVKTVGRQYVLEDSKMSQDTLNSRLSYLCETTGMKLRHNNFCARGVMVYVKYIGGDYWHERKVFKTSFFSNAELHRRAQLLFNRRPRHDYVREIGISCYHLGPSNLNQMSFFETVNKEAWITQAIDSINETFGSFTITFAGSHGSKEIVKQKIPFGTTRYFDSLCRRA